MAVFESGSISVGALFQDQFYRIPEYQRPYSWDDDNFDDLVNDTRDADRDKPYFLGTIVLHKEGEGASAVVDGQQRLTSLLILLATLRDAIKDSAFKSDLQDKIMQKRRVIDGIPERVRLEVKDRDIFQKVVVTDGGTLAQSDPQDLSKSEQRYVRATTIFHDRIATLTEEQKQEYVAFLTQKCVLIFLKADSFEQAFRLFEIVNDRGKQLRRIDILKSKNIAPDVISQETVRSRIAQKWETLESEVGEENFESVFFLLRLILVKDKPKGDLLSEFEDRVFSKRIITKGEDFSSILFEYVKLYREIFLDKSYIDTDDKFGIRYQSLIHIMDQEFSASEWRACLLYFANKFGRTDFYRFCLAVEKLYLSQWVNGVRKDERYAEYVALLQLIEKESSADNVISQVPFDAGAILNAVTRSDMYSAGYCKYALLRLELVTTEHDVPKRFNARSIEHVFPQNPKDGSQWLASHQRAQLPQFVNKIGNLVLISKSRNSSASNYEFDEKKKRYFKPRVTDYPRSAQILGYAAWDKQTIEDRTNEVAKIFLDDL